jgi:DNA repair exonuclease SbcCD ATPase subunit
MNMQERVVTLRVRYDSDEYLNPLIWSWSELLDMADPDDVQVTHILRDEIQALTDAVTDMEEEEGRLNKLADSLATQKYQLTAELEQQDTTVAQLSRMLTGAEAEVERLTAELAAAKLEIHGHYDLEIERLRALIAAIEAREKALRAITGEMRDMNVEWLYDGWVLEWDRRAGLVT